MAAIAIIVAASTVSPIWTAIGVSAAAVLGAIANMVFGRVNEATDRRRNRYAEAVQTLVAWTEFPYRVRRRTSDDPATLTALANHGHDLQERLAYHQARIATDHPDLARTYAETRAIINVAVGPVISDAWEHKPVAKPSDMNLSGWGPGPECAAAITHLQNEIQNRFGFRWLKRGTKRRIKRWIDRIRQFTRWIKRSRIRRAE